MSICQLANKSDLYIFSNTPTLLPECKITKLGKQSQENERREVRIYAIKEKANSQNAKKPLRKKEEAYSSLFIIVKIRTHIL